MLNSGAPGRPLHHMPYGFGRDVIPLNRAASADSAKDDPGCHTRSLRPVIHRPFDPAQHRNPSDVFALPDQVGHNPVFLPDLEVVGLQPDQVGTPEAASDENRPGLPYPASPSEYPDMMRAGVTGIDPSPASC